jgi:hypothetical protein
MDRLPSLHVLVVWGVTCYLVTHGMLPPAMSEAEARDLAAAFWHAGSAWVRSGWRRRRAGASR